MSERVNRLPHLLPDMTERYSHLPEDDKFYDTVMVIRSLRYKADIKQARDDEKEFYELVNVIDRLMYQKEIKALKKDLRDFHKGHEDMGLIEYLEKYDDLMERVRAVSPSLKEIRRALEVLGEGE